MSNISETQIDTALCRNTSYDVNLSLYVDKIDLSTSATTSEWRKQTTTHRASKALARHSRSALRCHSNETHAPIANTLNSAQLEGTPSFPCYIRGSVQ